MYFFILILLSIILLGYLFVQWANKPENVKALLEERAEEQRRKIIEDSLRKEAEKKEALIQQKTEAELQFVFEENFDNNSFKYLINQGVKRAIFENNKLHFSAPIVTPKSQIDVVLGLTNDEYENFVAELDIDLSEGDIRKGVVFNAKFQKNGALIGDYLLVGKKHVNILVGNESEIKNIEFDLEEQSQQKIRFEKKGKSIRISINGQLVFEKTVEKYKNDNGAIGIGVKYFNNNKDFNRSVKTIIKGFKLWKW